MDVVFFGTPDFALPALVRLDEQHHLKAVVTQPDKPRGRQLKTTPSPVKAWAVEHRIPVLAPAKIKQNSELVDSLKQLDPDIIAVAAYGKIIPNEILALPRFGCVNIHGSLLPKYRGAAPIQRALMDGLMVTGVSIMQVTEGLDEGPVLATNSVELTPDDNALTVGKALAEIGAELLVAVLTEIEAGTAKHIPQDEGKVSFAPPIDKRELEIDWARPAPEIWALIRALAPKPGAYTYWQGRRLKIIAARAVGGCDLGPGVLAVSGESAVVGTAEGGLELQILQPEAKKSMGVAEFVRGYHPETGDTLGREL